MTEKKLTPKQVKFCRLYVLSGNATEAAIKAGYSKRSAASIGSENLTKPEIVEYLKKAQVNVSEELVINADSVLEELGYIAKSNIQNYYEKKGKKLIIKDITKLPRSAGAAIQSFKEDIDEDGNKVYIIKLYDKVRACELLGKRLGLWKDDINLKSGGFTLEISNRQVKEVNSEKYEAEDEQ